MVENPVFTNKNLWKMTFFLYLSTIFSFYFYVTAELHNFKR